MTFKKQSSQLAASFCAIFVGDAGGELAERRRLLALDQPVLRGAQVFERLASSPVPSSNRRTLPIAIAAWSAKVVASSHVCLNLPFNLKASPPNRLF